MLIYDSYVYCSDGKDMFFGMEQKPPAAATAEEEELRKKPMPMKGKTAVGRVEASWFRPLSLLCDVTLTS